jgi:hypothetical protein
MPSRVLDFKTALEVFSPPLSISKGVSSKVFGYACVVHICGLTCALKCIFVGCPLLKRGINVIIPHHGNILSQ